MHMDRNTEGITKRRTKRRGHVLAIAGAVAGGWFAVPQAGAEIWDNGGADSNWSTPDNWNPNTEPTSASTASIGRQGASYDPDAFAVVTEAGEVASKLYMGWAGSTGTLVIVSGDLTVSGSEFYLGYQNDGFGHIIQSNGTVNSTYSAAGAVRLANTANGRGTYVLEGGALNVAHDVAVGHLGDGTLECRGGSLAARDIFVGSAAGATGRALIENDGAISARNLYVGNSGTGALAQNGGAVIFSSVIIGNNSSGTGTYVLGGGSLVVTNFTFYNGTSRFEQTNGTTVNAINTFRLGMNDAAARATYTMRGGALNVRSHFEAPYTLAAHSELRGWGTVTVTNASRNFSLKGANASVCADGFGEDHELKLNFTLFPDVDPNDPATRNGWYAVNRGKLTLPNVSVAANTVYWGEDAGGGPNRANAVKVVFAGRSGTGTLTGSLLAGDHGDVPAYDGAKKLAGVWRFGNSGFTFASVTLTFRYDPDAVAALGLAESDIAVYWNAGTPGAAWQKMDGVTRDEANNRITVAGVSGFGVFGVGQLLPKAGTLISIR